MLLSCEDIKLLKKCKLENNIFTRKHKNKTNEKILSIKHIFFKNN